MVVDGGPYEGTGGDRLQVLDPAVGEAFEEVPAGTRVEVLVDDPRSERDLPLAAEAEGHAVLEVEAVGSWLRILIEK